MHPSRKAVRVKAETSKSTVPESSRGGDFPEREFSKKTAAANQKPVSETGLNQHNPAKRTRNRVPPPQRERILQEYVAGTSIKDISKKEKRNRETVERIVHGPEMQQFVHDMRERFFALGLDAISAIRHSLTEQNDGRLAFQLLASIGVVPSPAERQAIIPLPKFDKESEIRKMAILLAEGAIRKNRFFNMPFEGEEELRQQVRAQEAPEVGKDKPDEKKTKD